MRLTHEAQLSALQRDPLSLSASLGRSRGVRSGALSPVCTWDVSWSCNKVLMPGSPGPPPRTTKTPASEMRSVCSLCFEELPR